MGEDATRCNSVSDAGPQLKFLREPRYACNMRRSDLSNKECSSMYTLHFTIITFQCRFLYSGLTANFSALADDTTIYALDSNPGRLGLKLEQDIQRVASWIESNGQRMNAAKTQLMVLGNKSNQCLADSVQVCIGEKVLTKEDSVR